MFRVGGFIKKRPASEFESLDSIPTDRDVTDGSAQRAQTDRLQTDSVQTDKFIRPRQLGRFWAVLLRVSSGVMLRDIFRSLWRRGSVVCPMDGPDVPAC